MVEEGGKSEEGSEREIRLERRRRWGTTGRSRKPDTVRRRRTMRRRERRRGSCSVGSATWFFSCAVDGGVIGERTFATEAFDSL